MPSAIKKTADLKRTMLDARKAKEENRRRHTREGESKPKAERKSRCSLLGQYSSALLTSIFFGYFQRSWLRNRDSCIVVLDIIIASPISDQRIVHYAVRLSHTIRERC